MTYLICIQDDILKEFLMKNRAEAKAVSIYEYNEEEHMRMERDEWKIRGAVEMCRDFNLSDEEIVAKLVEKYNLNEETAREYCK